MAKQGKTLSELISKIPVYENFKTKITCPDKKKKSVMKKIINTTKQDIDIIKIDDTDGVKIYYDIGWVIIRPSGTEPIFRIFSESKNKENAEKLAIKFKKLTE